LKARMKCQISLPEPSIMPNTVSSGSGMAQLLDHGAQLAAVEGARHHAAAAGLAAGRFGVVVGKHRRHVELHAGAAGEEVDGLAGPAPGRRRPARRRSAWWPRAAGRCGRIPPVRGCPARWPGVCWGSTASRPSARWCRRSALPSPPPAPSARVMRPSRRWPGPMRHCPPPAHRSRGWCRPWVSFACRCLVADQCRQQLDNRQRVR
jgi:hypothetical protein